MAGMRGNGTVPSLPPPRPKSPPPYPDLYGRRRESAKVQMMEREIGFLEEELKSIEGLHLASRSCKEVVDFVTGNSDPLIPTSKKTTKSHRLWKWLCRVSCFNFSWICCCSCTPHFELPRCCHCSCSHTCGSCSNPCGNCRMPNCRCIPCPSCESCDCLSVPKCSSSRNCSRCSGGSSCCVMPRCPPWPSCSCRRRCCTCYYPKCLKFNICSCCHNICCYPCYFCY